jgi:hypothetical protein
LSLAAPQLKSTRVLLIALAVSVLGAVGGEVSGGGGATGVVMSVWIWAAVSAVL